MCTADGQRHASLHACVLFVGVVCLDVMLRDTLCFVNMLFISGDSKQLIP